MRCSGVAWAGSPGVTLLTVNTTNRPSAMRALPIETLPPVGAGTANIASATSMSGTGAPRGTPGMFAIASLLAVARSCSGLPARTPASMASAAASAALAARSARIAATTRSRTSSSFSARSGECCDTRTSTLWPGPISIGSLTVPSSTRLSLNASRSSAALPASPAFGSGFALRAIGPSFCTGWPASLAAGASVVGFFSTSSTTLPVRSL